MRKYRTVPILVVVLIAAMLLPASTGAQEKTLRFILIPKLVHPWYQDVFNGAEDMSKFLEKAVGVKIKVENYAPPTANVVEHNKKIEAAIAAKPDGLGIACLDEGSNTRVIDEGIKAGIKVVTFDVDCPRSKRIGFAGGANYVADGAVMMEELAREMKYEGEIGLLIGSPTAPNHQLRTKGVRQVLAKYPKIKLAAEAADNDDLEKAIRLAEGMIAAHPNLKGMIGVNASAPIGLCKAIQSAKKTGKILLVGEEDLPDMLNCVRDGVAFGTLVQRVRQIGWWTVWNLWNLNQGKVIPQILDTGTFMIYKKDLETYTSRK